MLRAQLTDGEAVRLAKKALVISTMWLGVAALAVTAATWPAEAQTKRKSAKQIEEPIPDPSDGQPMTLIVSLDRQTLDIYRGTKHIISAPVSTGMRGYTTKAGVFSIMEKKRHHRSNLYSGAPMPWMHRLTWSGTALHAGVLPGYPASHGCIRLPFSFAPKLFSITTVGDNTVVARDRVAPVLIEHANLFQPLPQPAPPEVAKEARPERQSDNTIVPDMGLPVILARAEVSGITTDIPASFETTPSDKPAIRKDGEDTRTHAIDPFAAETGAKGSEHAVELTAGGTPNEGLPLEIAASEEVRNALVEAAVEAPPKTAASASPEPDVAAVVPVVAIAPVAEPANLAPALTGIALKLDSGLKAAGIEAAEPRSPAPLRILVTRRTQRDRIIDVQHQLVAMGHLEAQKFDGTLGRATVNAIKAFQKEHSLPENGAFSDDLEKMVYHIAGKEEPRGGHLYVRQEFGKLFDLPVSFRDPDKPLGTHLFTALKFAPTDTKIKWMSISLQGDDPATALDRLMIPDEVRRKISELLTPGSSLIIGDVAINSWNLPKGADFVVWTKDAASTVQRASVRPSGSSSPQRRQRQVTTPPQNNFGFFQQRRFQQQRGNRWDRGNRWAW